MFGYSSFQGKRATMEDFYDAKLSKIDDQTVGLFGVFDGHGGSCAAEYLKHHLFDNLIKHPKFVTDTKLALTETYQQTDSEFLKAESSIYRDDGSTASTAVLVGNHLYVANVGDSRAVILKAGEAIPLSEDHKPNRSDERQRIEQAGGNLSPYVMGITAQSTWRFDVPVAQGVHHAMNPDPYQGLWGGKHCRDSPVQTTRDCSCAPDACEAADKYYGQLEEVFKYSLPRGKVAGLFAESIQGVGGTVQFPKGFLKKAYELVRINGGVCIADEVQTGFGRTGDHFWGFEGHGVRPDIVTMAKGIGNGFPMAAVVTTPAIAEVLSQALHFNTFGGNPVACAVGMAVLDVIEEERTQRNCQVVGTYFLQELAKLRDQFQCVGDVRGKGLMIGVEMVDNRATKAPMNNKHFTDLWEDCKNMGVLIGRGALNGNVLRIKPPMCITKEDVDYAVAVLRKALQTHTEKAKRQAG